MSIYKKAQENIIKEYMSYFEKPTILAMARDSGIQKTRFFRLVNGMEMRLEEYLVLKGRIAVLSNVDIDLYTLVCECEAALSSTEMDELSKNMNRVLRKKKITGNIQTNLAAS